MAELESEFRDILLSQTFPVKTESASLTSSTYTDSESSSFSQEQLNKHLELNHIPPEAIGDLRRIAGRMIAAGYSRECVEAYARARRTVLDESFNKLGIDKLSAKNVRRLEWAVQEPKIRRWISVAKITVRVLFADERILSELIFKDLGAKMDDACFMETIRYPAVRLLSFVEAVSAGRRSPERLFRILDLHKVLSDLLPDIQVLFRLRSGEFIRKQAVDLLSGLAEAALGILSEFEKAVLDEAINVPISGGSIHPLTKYVMSYLHSMADHKEKLEELIVCDPPTDSSNLDFDMCLLQARENSPFVLHLFWIIVILKFNLEGKCKQYGDASLAHLFMMNNVHYVVQMIKGHSTLTEIYGIDYLNKLSGEYRLAKTSYLKTTCDRVLDCLAGVDDGVLSGVFKRSRTQRLKAFNGKFKETLRTQASWAVPDYELRDELRHSIVEMLVPVYTSFLGKYRRHVEIEKHPENYVQYSAEDVKKAVMDNLFWGH